VLEDHHGTVTAVAFSPDGKLASASNDNMVRVWEAATGSCLGVLEGHTKSVNAVAFSPDGELIASASYDKTVRVWEVVTGLCLNRLKHRYARTPSAIAFSPDRQYLHTNEGDFLVPWPPTPSHQKYQPSYVSIDDQWICFNKERLLWLPSEYRPTCVAIHQDVVCLGHSSGRTTFLKVNAA
jgi:WD40 repeat protein